MIHALAYIIFILPFTVWLGHELKKKYSLKSHSVWIAGACLGTIIGSYINGQHLDRFGNFILHASGGVAATLLFVYVTRTLKLPKFNWRLTLVILFAWTCMLGVINEIFEYSLELAHYDIFSFDTHDTWRDLVANTTGMLVTWLILQSFRQFDKH